MACTERPWQPGAHVGTSLHSVSVHSSCDFYVLYQPDLQVARTCSLQATNIIGRPASDLQGHLRPGQVSSTSSLAFFHHPNHAKCGMQEEKTRTLPKELFYQPNCCQNVAKKTRQGRRASRTNELEK